MAWVMGHAAFIVHIQNLITGKTEKNANLNDYGILNKGWELFRRVYENSNYGIGGFYWI